jgi:AraC family transcriptional regulator, L-rhamnose operon transcriptional activator RhaR
MSDEYVYTLGDNLFENTDIYINHLSMNKPTNYHAHDFVEIAYVASGGGIQKIGDARYKVNAGDITILNFDVPHQFIPGSDSNNGYMTVYNCVFKPGFFDCSLVASRSFLDITRHFLLQSFMTEDFNRYLNISASGRDSAIVFGIYDKMQREYDEKREGYVEILRAYLIELLVVIFRILRKSNLNNITAYENKEKDNMIDNIIDYMTENFNHKISLEKLAMQAFLSPSHFYRIFKDYTGMNVTEFIQKIRIEEACKLLKGSNRKITDIANIVGYKDYKYFYNLFKRMTGKNPSEYRK